LLLPGWNNRRSLDCQRPVQARLVIGAGGIFVRGPIAGANARHEVSVAAQEIEFEMSESQRDQFYPG